MSNSLQKTLDSVHEKNLIYTEQELLRLLKDIWNSRDFINIKEIDRLRAELKERKIL
jgi:hypothetical protein